MEDRNPKIIFFGAVTFILIIALSWMLSSGKVGLFAAQLEVSARKTQQVDATWQSIKSEEGSLAAFLFYNEAKDDYTYSIYINRPGLSFGYFFRAGGFDSLIGESVLVAACPIGDDTAYSLLSTNTGKVARIDVGTGDEDTQIELDPEAPFALALPAGTDIDTVSLYDKDGQLVPYYVSPQ